jgi:hypothetical protein
MAQITASKADKLNRMHPTFQELQFGTDVYEISQYSPVIISTAVTSAANATAKSVTIPFAMRVLFVVTECIGASGSGTLTLRKATTAITDAMECATDKKVVYSASIDDAQSTLAAGDNVNIIANGANDKGVVTIIGIRV